MKIELWSLSKIKPYKGNPRRHEPAVAAVARSIEQFGFRQPIVVDKKGVIIAGHVRFYASQELKLARVPVHVALDLTPHQARAYRLADNKTGELAEWDQNLLGLELRELSNVNFDIASLGFTAGEIAQLINGTPYGKTDPDDVPPKPKRAVTKPGDLYLLGAHRLLCGDSTKGDDLRRAMNGEKAAAVITDPPYGVGYVGKTKDALPVHNDGADTLLPLLDSALTMACELCVDGGCWYVAAPAGPQFFDFATVLTKLGVWRQTLVWAKHAIVMGRSDYHYQHEAVFYGWKQGGEHPAPADLPADDDEGDFRAEHDSIIYGWKPGDSHQPPPDRKQSTLWFFDRPSASREHPTMKPVALFERMVRNSTEGGAIVLEPFMGSGTTLIACERLGRRCFGVEISPQYCDVIVERWEKFTGKKAKLKGASKTQKVRGRKTADAR